MTLRSFSLTSLIPIALLATALVGCATDTADASEAQSAAALQGSSGAGEQAGPGRHKGRHDNQDPAARAAHMQERFAASDKNNDGFLTADEVPAERWAHMSVADANKDSKLTQEELKAAHESGALRPPEGRGHRDGPDGDKDPAARAKHAAERFQQADKNSDGFLTADEVPAERWAHMSVADANKDGKLTQEELRAAHESGALRPPEGRGRGSHRDGPPGDGAEDRPSK